MNKLVFLVEEASMANFLDGLLPRLIPSLEDRFQCVPHQGKNDLVKSVSKRIRRWREPGVHFVVMQDQDNSNCKTLKSHLRIECEKSGRSDILVRIVCRELEAWYIGEPEALTKAFPDHSSRILKELSKARYRNPDSVHRPSEVISRLIPEFQKRSGAQRIAEHMSIRNRSHSFRVFIKGIERYLK